MAVLEYAAVHGSSLSSGRAAGCGSCATWSADLLGQQLARERGQARATAHSQEAGSQTDESETARAYKDRKGTGTGPPPPSQPAMATSSRRSWPVHALCLLLLLLLALARDASGSRRRGSSEYGARAAAFSTSSGRARLKPQTVCRQLVFPTPLQLVFLSQLRLVFLSQLRLVFLSQLRLLFHPRKVKPNAFAPRQHARDGMGGGGGSASQCADAPAFAPPPRLQHSKLRGLLKRILSLRAVSEQ